MSPSGRLPYTVARAEADYTEALLNSTVSFDPFPEADFSEGVFIDYRSFDRRGVAPRFEFGFGLSYTEFAYANLSASLVVSGNSTNLAEYPDRNIPVIQGGHPQLWDVVAVVRCTVRNAGGAEGAEVAQLYVGVPSGAGDSDSERDAYPVRQLRGFVRVGPLVPGQAREVAFELTRRDLSVWDVRAQAWRLRRGRYALWVGTSSRDLRLEGSLTVE